MGGAKVPPLVDPTTKDLVVVETNGAVVPTPSEARERARASFYDRIGLLAMLADDPENDASDRIKAIEALARIGLGPSVTIEDVRTRLLAQTRIITEMLGDAAPSLLAKLRKVWT